MKISIVGAGFSGLTLAYFLTKKNIEVEVFESESQPGGMIATKQLAQGLVETAANGLWNTPQVEELLRDLKIPLAPSKPTRKNRYIFRQYATKWPLSILESITLFLRVFVRWLTRSLKPKPDETIEAWGNRVGGKAFSKYFLAPALQGIYAGDASRMSAEMILDRFFVKKKKAPKPKFKGTVSPDRGMGQLIESLTDWLNRRGVKIHYASGAKIPEGTTVIATSAWEAAQLLKPIAPKAAGALEKVETLPLISATLFFQLPPDVTRGFGCLFPQDQNFHSLGVLFNTDIFERRGRGRSETWILGGAHHPELLQKSDDELVSLILDDRVRLFSQFTKPVNVSIQRWPKALPHYTVDWKNTVAGLELPANVHLTGNYLGRIGLSRILEYNSELAEKMAEPKQ